MPKNRYLAVLAVALLFVLHSGCGGESPTAPTPVVEATPAPPVQTVLRLAIATRQNGNQVESVRRDTIWTVEVGAVCTDPTLPCPRPNRIAWNISGAFCEFLGDTSAPNVAVLCTGFGVTRVTVTSADLNARGETQVQVTF